MTKIWLDALTDRIEREKVFENFWKVFEHVKTKVLKKISIRLSIDRKIGLIDRNLYVFRPLKTQPN